MLSGSIHDALRARLTADFNTLTHRFTDAAEVSHVLHELIRATSGILCDLASTWSESHNKARRLPPEMLSACFAMLKEFPDRMTVSHVSRAWRSVALAHPAIWADIDFSMNNFCDEPALLEMALSRTGRYPVDLCLPDFDADAVVAMCVAQHMNHIRVIEWTSKDPQYQLRLPAPMLEVFTGMDDGSVIHDDFLGGRAGKLKELNLPAVCFPPTCPALSTVTALSLGFPIDPEHAATYSWLFRLFPVLQILSLRFIRLDVVDFLPSGPAPPTLDRLELEALDPHLDLVRYYADWKSENNLREVTLIVDGSTVLECNLQDFITGAIDLTIFMTGGPLGAMVTFMARCPGQRSRVFEFTDEAYDDSQPAKLVLSAKSSLARVWALDIPANTLGAFVRLGVFSVFPKLAELRISIEGNADHDFAWESLADLPRVLEARPKLNSVVITVACDPDEDDRPLVAADAHALLVVLEIFASGLPGIRIRGFTEAAAHDAQIRQDLNIQFDTSL